MVTAILSDTPSLNTLTQEQCDQLDFLVELLLRLANETVAEQQQKTYIGSSPNRA